MVHLHCAQTVITASLSTLPSANLDALTASISAVSRRHLSRLAAVLSSPILFTVNLRRLQSLSLRRKSLLIAQHLLSSLALLKQYFAQNDAVSPPPPYRVMKLRDLDTVLLLLLLCELHQHRRELLDSPISRWRVILRDYFSDSILRISGLGGDSLVQFIESAGRCYNLIDLFGGGCAGGEEKEVPASSAAVVALPSVEASGGRECVICTDEMRVGRVVCELPCRHFFHWMCILPWLRKRDTCPCCRRRLPTEDVRREIERLLEDLAAVGRSW